MSPTLSDPEYVLRGVAGVVFGRSYHLLTPTTVGRSPECDICLPSEGVSRTHARLRPLDYGVEVEDLKSTNGCFLNGQRVTLGIARPGDEIAFDELRFLVEPRRGRPVQESRPASTQRKPRRGIGLTIGIVIVLGALAFAAVRWLA